MPVSSGTRQELDLHSPNADMQCAMSDGGDPTHPVHKCVAASMSSQGTLRARTLAVIQCPLQERFTALPMPPHRRDDASKSRRIGAHQ